MEGDNIQGIIDVAGFSNDLKTVIEGISGLEAKIAEANEKAISVSVDLKGAENISDITAGIKQQAEAIKELTAVQQENKMVLQQIAQATQQYGDNAASITKQINSTGNEVRQLTRDLQALQDVQRTLIANSGSYKQLGNEIANVTTKLGGLLSAMKEAGNTAKSLHEATIKKAAGNIDDKIARKAIELEKEKGALQEQLRKANEKEDIASVDKVVNDARAKYALLYKDLERSKKAYIKSITGSENGGYSDANTVAMDGLMAELDNIKKKVTENETEEFLKQSSLKALQHGAGESAGDADLAQREVKTGAPDHVAMMRAQDLETKAKADAENVAYVQLKNAYIANGDSIENIQKQHNEKLEQIDLEGYEKRLTLANAYFAQISQHLEAADQLSKTVNNTEAQKKTTAAVRRGGSLSQMQKKIDKAGDTETRKNALSDIETADKETPGAQQVLSSNERALNNAKAADDGSDESKAKIAAAQKEVDASRQKMAELVNIEATGRATIAKLDMDDAQKKLEKEKEYAESSVQIAQEAVSAIATIKNNEFAHENDLLNLQARNVQLNAQQQIQAIQASTGYAIQKQNQLSLVNAQAAAAENTIEMKKRQLAVEQARYNRSAAEASILVNTAAGIVKALVEPGWPEAIPIMIATAAIGAVQFAAASSAPIPTYRYGTQGHPGGLAIIGEGGEREFVQTPTGESFWSKPQATLVDMPEGSKVIPMHKMIDYAIANITAPGHNYNIQEQNERMFNEAVVKFLSDKYEHVGEEIVNAINQNGFRTPNYDRQIKFEVNKAKYSRK